MFRKTREPHRVPATAIVPNEKVEAMKKVALTRKFGVRVRVTAREGEPYPYNNGGAGKVPQGKSHVAIHGGGKEGLSGFNRAVKSVERHEKKLRKQK